MIVTTADRISHSGNRSRKVLITSSIVAPVSMASSTTRMCLALRVQGMLISASRRARLRNCAIPDYVIRIALSSQTGRMRKMDLTHLLFFCLCVGRLTVTSVNTASLKDFATSRATYAPPLRMPMMQSGRYPSEWIRSASFWQSA